MWPTTLLGKQKSAFEFQAEVAYSLQGFISLDLIRQFEHIINSPKVSESTIQEFLEQHPAFLYLFGDYEEYKSQILLVPQILMEYEYKEGGRPDFLLRDPRTDFWDILSIKLPGQKLVRGIPQRRRLADAVMEAKAQLIEYKHYFDDRTHRQFVKDRYGIDLYYPRLYVLIGRASSFHNWAEKRKLLNTEREIEVVTYDDLLQLAKRRWLLRPLLSLTN